MKTVHTTLRFRSRRGSILIAAIIFTTIMSFLLGSYLKMASTELRMADRNYTMSALVNLAEAGAEEAMWSIKKNDWSGWTQTGSIYKKQINSVFVAYGKTGTINVIVDQRGANPLIFAQGKTTQSNSQTVLKQLKLELYTRSLFAMGLVAKDSVRFSGGSAKVDSYQSSTGIPHSSFNRSDNGSIGSISVDTDAVDIANAEIYGYVATGSAWPDAGPNGMIYGSTTPSGVKIDTSRVSTDFSAEFPDVIVPTQAAPILALPAGNAMTIGVALTKKDYKLTDVEVKSNQSLTIVGDGV
jgi:hypothetical protein